MTRVYKGSIPVDARVMEVVRRSAMKLQSRLPDSTIKIPLRDGKILLSNPEFDQRTGELVTAKVCVMNIRDFGRTTKPVTGTLRKHGAEWHITY